LLLKQGGLLCIVDLDEDDGRFHKAEKDFKGYHGFNQGALQNIAEKIGLTSVKSHTFYRDQRIIDEVSLNYSLFIMSCKKV